ncbi:DUF4097 family beta strand repeat protein [Dysgonomonas sp. Marseille-P4677]|uniref:DUF4097 family beta strand repeat-containing protein n=1 Tax=Dysgonomonas sp. Marseille-P4677 TaxID=2364790 RepID=UPI001912B52D|nr:DUF4097 family beta strand repeat-containing protein [Dysgonomonas sp. Marseille-P4677]MBK5722704.1 DUF4097 family beta strand repeat protein [Dysgonomonas sp. Marseille-P4677]
MKKYILLMVLCFVAFSQSQANEGIKSIPQDSFKIFKKKLDLDVSKMLENIDDIYIDTSRFPDVADFNINIDSINVLAQNATKEALEVLQSPGGITKRNAKVYRYNFSKGTDQKSIRTSVRIENKTFSNISEVEFFHKYGNIVVRESNSKQVELEIQYLDRNNATASCNVSVVGKLLSITTNSGGKSNASSKINYIIGIPKNTAMNINMDYGNIKIDQLSGGLIANLSYSEMSIQKANNISLKSRYSDVKIGEMQNADLSGSYSDIRINRANKIMTSGNYNDYRFNDVQTLTIDKSTSYGDCKIGSVGRLDGSIMYTDIDINNLLSDISISSQYGDVMLRNVSPKAKNISIKGSYCDITIGLSPGFSSTFDATLNYGDLTISRKFSVKYTESIEKGNRTVKKGQIGTGNPTANIVVSNNYADIDIR